MSSHCPMPFSGNTVIPPYLVGEGQVQHLDCNSQQGSVAFLDALLKIIVTEFRAHVLEK
jgi:hypothetical protein